MERELGDDGQSALAAPDLRGGGGEKAAEGSGSSRRGSEKATDGSGKSVNRQWTRTER